MSNILLKIFRENVGVMNEFDTSLIAKEKCILSRHRIWILIETGEPYSRWPHPKTKRPFQTTLVLWFWIWPLDTIVGSGVRTIQ